MKLLIPALLLLTSLCHAQFTILQNCEGNAGRFSGASPEYKDHPDPGGDVGPSHIVEITGQDFTVFDRSCKQLQKITTRQFFINAGGMITGITHEPRILYDALIGQWIATTCDSGTGNNYVAVSAGNNPISSNTSAWKLTTIPNSGFRDDFLRPAWDANGLYITHFGGLLFDNVVAFTPADLQWSGSRSVTGPSGGIFKNLEFELFPSTDTNPAKLATDPELLLFRDFGSGTAQSGTNIPFNLVLRKITWSGAVASTNVTSTSSGFLFNSPTPIVQPRGTIRPQENHRGNAYWHNGLVYAVIASGPCASQCAAGQPATTRNGFFWFKIDPVNRTILEKGFVFDAVMDHYFPSIVVDGAGNVVIVDSCSDASANYASVCAFYRQPSDAPGRLNGPTILKTGSSTYPSGCSGNNPVGWGLWNTTVIDPNDSSKIWTIAEYGEFATTCAWATRILQFQVRSAMQSQVTIDSILNGGSFLPGPVSSGTWATIIGQNLSATTRQWRDSDFNGNALPTNLDGVSVALDGNAAYISYVSPTQINFLVPDGKMGSMNVQVTNPFGTSNALALTTIDVSPAWFQFSSRYPASVHIDGTYIGPPDLLSGNTFAPTAPGETIMLFGTGFGPSIPPQPAGRLIGPAAVLANPVVVSIGGKLATVTYSGLTASGLDQFNVIVPADAPSGDQAIVASVRGVQTQPGMFITVR